MQDELTRIDHAVIEKVLKDKTCLAVMAQGENRTAPTQTVSSALPDDIRKRFSMIEASLADLNRRHENLSREVKAELLFKYQELLIVERKRYDQLMTKYTRLVDMHQEWRNNTSPVEDGKIGNNLQEVKSGKDRSGWKGKLGKVLKGGER